MSELLIRIENAPHWLQRTLAIGILVAVIAIFGAAIMSVSSALYAINGEIQDGREEIGRMQAIIARAAAMAPLEPGIASPYLPGDNASLAQASLQQSVTGIASRSGASIASLSSLPIRLSEGVPLVGVRIQVDGSLPAMQNLISTLEGGEAGLVIDDAQIRQTNMTTQDKLNAPIQLSAQLTVSGAGDPKISMQEKGK